MRDALYPYLNAIQTCAQTCRAFTTLSYSLLLQKLLVLIRHGQSTYNAGAGGRVEPDVWDAPLTELGMKQVCSTGKEGQVVLIGIYVRCVQKITRLA